MVMMVVRTTLIMKSLLIKLRGRCQGTRHGGASPVWMKGGNENAGEVGIKKIFTITRKGVRMLLEARAGCLMIIKELCEQILATGWRVCMLWKLSSTRRPKFEKVYFPKTLNGRINYCLIRITSRDKSVGGEKAGKGPIEGHRNYR